MPRLVSGIKPGKRHVRRFGIAAVIATVMSGSVYAADCVDTERTRFADRSCAAKPPHDRGAELRCPLRL